MNWQICCSRTLSQRWVITLVLLWQLIPNGAAIKCFVCDSTDNPSCADLKSNKSIVAEECTMGKLRSLDTWLFELNKFFYFDTNNEPLMNCQKVVATDPTTRRSVTARLCQLNTGDSDACAILRSKLRIDDNDAHGGGGTGGNYARRSSNGNEANGGSPEQEEFHCSICSKDRCNAANTITISGSVAMLLPLAAAMLMNQMAGDYRDCVGW